MAIYRKGSDPVALRASAERIATQARECDVLKGEAARAIHALKGHWGGGDLDQLMSRWPPVEAQLAQFGTDLSRLAEALRRNAGQQDGASALGATGWGGFPAGPVRAGGPIGGGPIEGGSGGSGGSGGGSSWHEDLYDSGGMAGYYAVMNFAGLQGSAFGLVGHFGKLDDFTFAANMFGGSNWRQLFMAGLSADELGVGMTRFAGAAGVVGKAIGPIGAAISWGNVASDVASGDYDRAGYNAVMAGLGTAALLPIPPANLICGGAAAVMGIGQLIYDNNEAVRDFVDSGVDAVGDLAGDVADLAGDAWDAITPW